MKGIRSWLKPGTLKRVIKLAASCVYFVIYRAKRILLSLTGRSNSGTYVVLAYHGILSQERDQFARQMDALLRYAKPVRADWEVSLPCGGHYAAVTFDDGLVSVVENALPELQKRNVPCALFVVTGKLGQEPDWPYYSDDGQTILSADELRKLPDAVSIGSHSVSHRILTELCEMDAKREIGESRRALQRLLGRKVEMFSFPYGEFNDDLVRWCSEAGYERVFTTQPVLTRTDVRDFVIGRVRTDPSDWPLEFRLKLLGAYQWLPFASAAKRKILFWRKPSGTPCEKQRAGGRGVFQRRPGRRCKVWS